MAEHDYTLLNYLELDAGSWADWFSGTMSFGAVVTALLGYVIVHRQRVADNKDRERQVAEAIGWKLLRVYNDTSSIGMHLKEGLDRGGSLGLEAKRFMTVQPLVVLERPLPDLAQEEVSFLIKLKAADLMMDLNDSIARAESIRIAMSQYKLRHEELFRMMPTPTEMAGPVATHHLTAEQEKKLNPYAILLDAMLENITDLVGEGVDNSEAMLARYVDTMKGYFGKWHFVFEGAYNGANLAVYRSCPYPRTDELPQ